jgi:hypothetical protein
MTLYAIRSTLGVRSLDEDAEVVDQSRHGWEFREQAITLWRLVDKDRANQIEAIRFSPAALREPLVGLHTVHRGNGLAVSRVIGARRTQIYRGRAGSASTSMGFGGDACPGPRFG